LLKNLLGAFQDARLFQSAGQITILAIGIVALGFEVTAPQIGATLPTCLLVQWLGSRLTGARFDWRSAVIATISLSLLLRADSVWPMMLAGAIAVGSKFALRYEGRHIFNPANAGIVAMILFTDAAWTAPGEWGVAPWFALYIMIAGSIVTWRASRLDVPVVFLGTFALLLFGRALYLGDPFTIPLHRIGHAELILFAFFMISDPKTTPDGRLARAAFTALAATIGYVLTYHFYTTDGIFYGLALACLVRPFIERFDAGARRYQWGDKPARLPITLKKPPIAAPAE
jgi:Na+-transporting NADH:ubiquinone oxidoreductase subunit NqrB